MKSRLLIVLSVLVLVAALVAINAASFVRIEQAAETELAPDRSTMNSGGTGTLAFYEYLRQRGVPVSRWRRPLEELSGPDAPASLVMVGPLRRGVTTREAAPLLRWVEAGGRLVLIDRTPDPQLLPAAGRWLVHTEVADVPDPDTFPDDAENMTRGVPLLRPSQPTALTRHVSEVTRSRFASRLFVYRAAEPKPVAVFDPNAPPAPTPGEEEELGGGVSYEPPPPAAAPPTSDEDAAEAEPRDAGAPVVHVAD